ncbi:flippase [Haloarcula sp. H-GB5]
MTDSSSRLESISSLGSISQGASLYLIGKAFRQIILFVLNLILTRGLGASVYGIYSYLMVLMSFLKVISRLGADNSLLRFLPEFGEDPQSQRVMLTIATSTTLIASASVATVVFFTAPLISAYTLNESLFIDVLKIGAFALPFIALSSIVYSSFKGIERMDYNVLSTSIFEPLLKLIFVGGTVWFGYSVIGATKGLIAASLATLAISAVVLQSQTQLDRFSIPSEEKVREYYNFSIPLTFTQIGNVFYNRVDLLMVGLLLSGDAVGIYNISILIAGVLALPLNAFNQLFPPIASKLYQDNKLSELDETYSTITRWIFTIALLPAIATILFASDILFIFGSEFTAGFWVLVLFTIAQLTNCMVGPSGYLLMMTDHQYVTMYNQVISGVLNAILNYVLITRYGFLGAAIATATVLSGINIIRVIQVWYFEGIYPYNQRYLKPIAAGTLSALVMYLCKTIFSGYQLLVVGGVLGTVIFYSTLMILGFEDEEKEIFWDMIDRA